MSNQYLSDPFNQTMELLINRKAKLTAELAKITAEKTAEIEEVDLAVKALEKIQKHSLLNVESEVGSNEYKKEWKWVDKVKFAIRMMKAPSTVNDIATFLSKFENKIANNLESSKSSISSMLSVYIQNDEVFTRSFNEGDVYVYSLKSK